MKTKVTIKTTTIINFILGVIIVLLIGIVTYQCSNPKVIQLPPKKEYIHDSIIVNKETIKWKTKTIETKYYDTIILYDTIEVPIYIPIETKLYNDTIKEDSSQISVGIKYSGFKTSLDSVWINYSYIPKEVVKTKTNGFGQYIGIGIQVGYGLGVNNTIFQPFPYIGVGITYGWGYHW